ncbi:LA_2272/LA_2273 family lipoprotein [Leptospira alexanderi]|uniref:LA_2272/LA_2273 family lipoprotein n=1 Tax=Leptospira alexanderi TaxID=100053 RepID=UPI0009910E2D|nr:hypothetical protein [Leptospira alexanderi]
MKKTFKLSFLLLFFCWIFHGCGVALTPKATVKVPPKTETEIFRLNLFYGRVHNLYGLNLGIINNANRLIGTQIGIANETENDSIGAQVGLLNYIKENLVGLQIGGVNFVMDDKAYVAQIGLFNQSEGGFTIQTGAVNKVESEGRGHGGIQLGFYNEVTLKRSGNQIRGEGTYFTVGVYNYGGKGVKIGLLNSSPGGIGLSVGVINTGEEGNFLIGILNFCEDGFPSVMIGLNYCWQLGFMR